jgi:hypothetical protein
MGQIGEALPGGRASGVALMGTERERKRPHVGRGLPSKSRSLEQPDYITAGLIRLPGILLLATEQRS